MAASTAFGSPIPLSEIESVLAWVDTFKLSRPTKKINRDFSDAVLLAEILTVHYPKLVEMHNYPPRNSHALKLNNWMTLNRKVLKKLKLNLCCNTMEQLANSAPGIIERVLVMVRDKIRRDEDLNKTMKDAEQTMSSGGSYYEACGDDEHVLVVPVKTRVNGVLEVIQQKVVSHDSYLAAKEELKDAKDTAELLKQKVEHLDNLLKLKDERIDELQKQLERKQSRRKDVDLSHNSLSVPFDIAPPTPMVIETLPAIKIPSAKSLESNKAQDFTKEDHNSLIMKTAGESKTLIKNDDSRIPVSKVSNTSSLGRMEDNKKVELVGDIKSAADIVSFKNENSISMIKSPYALTLDYKISNKIAPDGSSRQINTNGAEILKLDVDRVKSDVFKEVENVDTNFQDIEEFKDSEQDIITIEDTIQNELDSLCNHIENNKYDLK